TANSLIFTVTNTDSQVVKIHTQPNCYTPPQVTLNGYCEGNGITAFSASISGSPLGTFSYTVTDQNGGTVASGDLSELFNGVTYTGDYTSLTLSVSGTTDPVSVNPKTVSNCYTAPEYGVDAFCYKSDANGAFAVSIEDDGYTPLPGTTVTYEVVDQNGTVLESGNYNGGGYFSPFIGYTSITINLYVNGELVDTATSTECYYPPVYVADGVCDYQAGNGAYRFTASNIGGTPLTTEATFEIVDENGTQVASGNISQLAGLMPIIGTYNSLTMTLFTTEGTIDRQADTLACYQPPVLVASGVCADQNGGFSFSVVNTGGAIVSGFTLPNYSITDVNGTELASGVVTLPFTPVSVTSENAPVTMSFSGGDIAVESAVSPSDCFQSPAFVVNVYCGEDNGEFVVAIRNIGGVIVDTRPTYEIFIDGASQGVVEFGNGDLPFDQTLPAGKYGNVSVTVTYGETSVSADNSTCYKQPEYTPTGYCGSNGQFFFTLSQTGGGTPVDGGQPTFEITGDGFTTVTCTMNQLAGLMPIVGVYENG
ncbi:MAG: hypothetical protein KJ043_18830, partial [Anaerolineae bacterium]|nr:hypothetical protein [Anaerolineae bacterium]